MAESSNINLKNFYSNVVRGGSLLYGHQFIVTFEFDDAIDIKYGGENIFEPNSNGKNCITYYVNGTTIPKIDIKENTVNFLSQDFVIPGNVMYQGTWNVTLMTTNSLSHWLCLREWARMHADIGHNGGGIKYVTNCKAHVRVLDNTMTSTLHDFVLVGIFPSKVPDIPMKYENQANCPSVQVTFTYQYMYEESEGDPLL